MLLRSKEQQLIIVAAYMDTTIGVHCWNLANLTAIGRWLEIQRAPVIICDYWNFPPALLKGAGWLNLSEEIGSLGVAFDYESVFGLVPKT